MNSHGKRSVIMRRDNGNARCGKNLRQPCPCYKKDNFNPDKGGSGGYPVCMAINRKRNEMLKLFLESGMKVNDPRFRDEPLLHRAVSAKNAEAVELLLKARADKKARDKSGKTAEDIASPEMLRLLK